MQHPKLPEERHFRLRYNQMNSSGEDAKFLMEMEGTWHHFESYVKLSPLI